jgi:ribosomal protein L37E
MYSLNVCNHGVNMKDKCERCGREAYKKVAGQ